MPCDVGEAVANVLSNPERDLKWDLQTFARIVERGGTRRSRRPDTELVAWDFRGRRLRRDSVFIGAPKRVT